MVIILLFLLLLAVCGTLGAVAGQVGMILGLSVLAGFYMFAFDLHVILAFLAALASIFVVAVAIDWHITRQYR